MAGRQGLAGRPVCLVLACCLVAYLRGVDSEPRLAGTRDVTTYYTRSDVEFPPFFTAWFLFRDRNSAVLEVKSCGDARIRLSYKMDNASAAVADIQIGGRDNDLVEIVDKRSSKNASRDTKDVLHCAEFRTFWIHWMAHSVSLGRGPVVGQQPLLTLGWTQSLRVLINEVGIDSGSGFSAAWRMEDNLGYNSFVHTSRSHGYRQVTKTVTQRVGFHAFKVFVCSDVSIALRSPYGVARYYIRVGQNGTNTACLEDASGQREPVCATPPFPLLSCVFFMAMWVSWRDSQLQLGAGDVYGKMSVVQMPYEGVIHELSFSTAAPLPGLWAFNDDLENRYMFWSREPEVTSPHYTSWVRLAPRQQHVDFHVRACANAWIVLSKNEDLEDGSTLHIKIGGGAKHDQLVVYRKPSEAPVYRMSSMMVVHCGLALPYYVSWAGGVLRVGMDPIVNANPKFSLSLVELGMASPNVVGFTATEASAAWSLSEISSGLQFSARTPAGDLSRSVWVTARSRYHETFRVQSCGSVDVLLSALVHYTASDVYRITIGADGENVTIVGDDPTAAVSTPADGLLRCTGYRRFVVSWNDGYVRLWRGAMSSQQEVLSLAMRGDGDEVRAVRLSADDADADWQLRADYVNYFISSSEEENSQIVLRSGTRFLTFQLSGQRATVVLRNDHHVDLYRIHLWVETNRVSLANGTHTLAESTVENPLTREDSGDFWLSWHDRALVVGHSQTVGEQVLVRTNLSEDIDVAAVSMYGGEGVPLDWMCSTDQASSVERQTGSSVDPTQFSLNLLKSPGVLLRLRSCGEAVMVFSLFPYDTLGERVYEVHLQEPGGTHSVTSAGGVVTYARTSEPDVLSCSAERQLWVMWYGGQLAVGRGDAMGRRVLLAYEEPLPALTRSIAVSTPGGNGTWRFSLGPPRDAAVDVDDGNKTIDDDDDDDGWSSSLIAGVAVACVAGVFILVLILIAAVCYKRRVARIFSVSSPTRKGSSNKGLPMQQDSQAL